MTSAAPRERERDPSLAILVAALVVGAFVRVYNLGALSLYYDELYATRIHGLSLRNLVGVVARTAFYDQHPPLYYLTALAWTSRAGATELGLRSLSALAGVALIAAVYALGRELGGRRVGAWAAAITAVLPLEVYYAREGRMYAMLALTGTLSSWLLVRLARGDRAPWIAPAWWTLAVATALTHYFGAVHVFAMFLTLAMRGRSGLASLPAWLARFGLVFAVFVPFAFFAAYQAVHFDSSYLGTGARVYVDVLAWLGGAHQNLPLSLAWTLPLMAAVALGLRASWSERAPSDGTPLSAPPALSPFVSAVFVLSSLGAFVAAAGVFVLRNRIADKITAVEMSRGESQLLSIVQGQTATVAAFFGALAAGVFGLLLPASDRVSAALARRHGPTPADANDPALSLPRVALVMVAVPLALSVVAGLAGKPLVLVRNFVLAAPFIALLAARGLASLDVPRRAAVATAIAAVSLGVAARIGAAPPGLPGGDAVRPWLLHTYFDWRALDGITAREPASPIVVMQHYATDAVIHYRGHHGVVRVRELDGALTVGQVRIDDGTEISANEGERWHPELTPRFYLIEMGRGLAHDAGLSRRLLDAARANHECSVAGSIPGGVTVYDCSADEAVAVAVR